MAARSDGGNDALVRDALASLTADLRRHRPAKVVAFVDGEAKPVAVPGSKRTRWENVAKVLLTLEWTRVELLDGKGALLHTVNAEPAPLDEDPEADVNVEKLLGSAPGGLSKEHGLLVLMLKAQQVALSHQAATLSTVTDAYRTVTETVFRRLEHMEGMFGRSLQLAHDAAQRVSQASGDDREDPNDAVVLKLLEKSGVLGGNVQGARLEKLLGRAEKFFGAESKVEQAPPNGAAKGA